MIYDHIHNIHLYKGISPALDLGLDFITKANESLPNGVSEIDKGVNLNDNKDKDNKKCCGSS